MGTVLLSTREDLDAHRASWQAVYDADTHATVHRSWFWQHNWASVVSGRWGVMAVGRPGDFRAYLPFCLVRRSSGVQELRLGGSEIAAAGGFLCAPGHEQQAFADIAAALTTLSWDRAVWHDVADTRLNRFIEALESSRCRTTTASGSLYSAVALPDSWDGYLSSLSHATRANLRKRTRQLEALPRFRSGVATDARSVERYSATLLELWQRRWGPKPQSQVEEIRSLFRTAAAHGQLRLQVMCAAGAPVAGLAGFLDPRGGFHCFMSAHDPRYAPYSPSKVAMARAIEWSIAEGYRRFSFGRGSESYKGSLGAEWSTLTNLQIHRASLLKRLKRLTRRLGGAR